MGPRELETGEAMKTYLDVESAIDEVLKAAGCSDAQRTDACLVLKSDFTINADKSVGYTPRGKTPADGLPIEDARILEHLKATRPHLFPAPIADDLAERAFAGRGNITARGQLIREVGQAEADKIAQRYGLRNTADTRPGKSPEGAPRAKGRDNAPSNPWSKSGFNVTKQGQIVRALGIEKAAAMARAAGSYIGATRPAD